MFELLRDVDERMDEAVEGSVEERAEGSVERAFERVEERDDKRAEDREDERGDQRKNSYRTEGTRIDDDEIRSSKVYREKEALIPLEEPGVSAPGGDVACGRLDELTMRLRQLYEADAVLPPVRMSEVDERMYQLWTADENVPLKRLRRVREGSSRNYRAAETSSVSSVLSGNVCVVCESSQSAHVDLETARDRPRGSSDEDDNVEMCREVTRDHPIEEERKTFSQATSDGLPSTISDARECEPGVDRCINRRCGRQRLPSRHEGDIGHVDLSAAADAARTSPEDSNGIGDFQRSTEKSGQRRGEKGANDYVETTLPYMDDGGILTFEGHRFKLKDAFLLFYAAQRAGERVIRAVSLSLRSQDAVKEWMGKLEAVSNQRGVATNVLRIFVADAMEIWATAENALTKRRLVKKLGESCYLPKELEVRSSAGAEVAGSESHSTEPITRAVAGGKPPGILMQTIGFINGKPEEVYNDSGADVSCISTATVDRLGLKVRSSPVTVYNPNGTPFTCRGSTYIPLSFGGREFGFEFQVLDDLDVSILVGDDFLRKFNCRLSYGARCVEYDGIPVKTIERGQSKKARRAYRSTEGIPVSLGEGFDPKPGLHRDVLADIELPDGFVYGTHTWIFEPLMLTERTFGVMIAPSVVKLEGRSSVRVRIVGGRGLCRPTPIPSGTVLGVLRVIRHDDEEKLLRGEIRMLNASLSCEGLKIGTDDLDAISGSQREMARATERSSMEEWEVLKGSEFRKELAAVVERLSPELTVEERQALEDTLVEFRQTLMPVRLGSTHVTTVDIDPGTAKPVCHRDRRWSPQEAEAIKLQVAGLLEAGLIEPSDSPWSSRLVCAPKKGADGTKSEIRVCVDFRDVNALCVKDAYPSPNIEATLDQLNKAKWYSSIDLAKGYHQVPLTERAKQICSFRCPSGFFRYTRMPFGIMNAPAAFQRMMDVVLRDIAWKCCMVYMDDVIVYSSDWMEHVDHIHKVLTRIRDAGLTVGLRKCHFGGKEVSFLGYIVSEKGIRPDPAKVAAVRNFELPQTLSELRSFLGLAGQFRKFVRHYGDIVRPLQQLTRNDAHGLWTSGKMWTDDRIVAFEAIKAAVAEEVTLAHPRFDRPLLMVCDASDHGMGAMLAQLDDDGNERPVAFTSATFYGPALRYTTTEKEGLAVVWAAAQFRPYIHGVPTVVVTDHAALTWILSRGNPPARIAHWVMELSQYDLTFIHRKGAHNHVADALSRLQSQMDAPLATDGSTNFGRPNVLRVLRRSKRKSTNETAPGDEIPADKPQEPPIVVDPEKQLTETADHSQKQEMTPADRQQPDTRHVGASEARPSPKTIWIEAKSSNDAVPDDLSMEEFITEQIKDVEIRAMRGFVQNGVLPEDPTLRTWIMLRNDEFLMRDGLLLKAEPVRHLGTKTVKLLLVVPKTLRWQVISACHDSKTYGGHMDAGRTCARARTHYWWSRLYTDVHDYVRGCLTCRSVGERTAGPAPISKHAVPQRPFEYMAVDLLAMPESKAGNKYAMVVMDHFSRYATVVAIPDKSAVTVARALIERVILIHGPPKYLLSDQGGEFDNQLLIEIAEKFDFRKIFTTPYRPQSDGLVERFNRTLLRLLRCFVDESHANWDDVLPYVLFAYNTAVSSTTKETPFTLVYGRNPPSPTLASIVDATGKICSVTDPSQWRKDIQAMLSEDYLDELARMNEEGKLRRNTAVNGKRRVNCHLRPGLLVMMANHGKPLEQGSGKLSRKQKGLSVIVRMITPVTAEVRKVGDAGHSLRKVHIDQLEPVRYNSKDLVVLDSPFPHAGPREVDDGDSEQEHSGENFEVEKVVGMRIRGGELQFKVRWKGFSEEDDQWMSETDLDCARLIEEFVALRGDAIQRLPPE